MKILDYKFSNPDWEIGEASFQDFNLIIGDSGTGKTRLLNTLFNIGRFVVQKKIGNDGHWEIALQVGKDSYSWEVTMATDNGVSFVEYELLSLNGETLLERSAEETIFKGQHRSIPQDEMSISHLRAENVIKPLYDGFARIIRRKFFTDDSEKNAGVVFVDYRALDALGKRKDLLVLFREDLGLNPKLYILSTYFPDLYQKIVDFYTDIFPFITDMKVLDGSEVDLKNFGGNIPLLCIKEKSVSKWLPLMELSSGMKKALLLLTDLVTLPKGTIYLIDEYENSLGIGPVDLLPNFLLSEDIDIQLFVTSHLPHLISKVPVEHWYIAHRKGANVSFRYGEDLVERYGISSQEKYIQLLNDPWYNEGVE